MTMVCYMEIDKIVNAAAVIVAVSTVAVTVMIRSSAICMQNGKRMTTMKRPFIFTKIPEDAPTPSAMLRLKRMAAAITW